MADSLEHIQLLRLPSTEYDDLLSPTLFYARLYCLAALTSKVHTSCSPDMISLLLSYRTLCLRRLRHEQSIQNQKPMTDSLKMLPNRTTDSDSREAASTTKAIPTHNIVVSSIISKRLLLDVFLHLDIFPLDWGDAMRWRPKLFSLGASTYRYTCTFLALLIIWRHFIDHKM